MMDVGASMGRGMTRDILIYADVNINLIDGSAVWLASLTEMLSLDSELSINVLLKNPLTCDILIHELVEIEHINFIDPWQEAESRGDIQSIMNRNRRDYLDEITAATLIHLLDEERGYDRILIRGPSISYHLCGQKSIAEKLIIYITNPPAHSAWMESSKLREMHSASCLTLCQTEMAKDVFVEILGDGVDFEKIDILNPMIPDSNFKNKIRVKKNPSIGYSGKFSPPYMIEEMFSAFKKIRNVSPESTFEVVGDKFHNKPHVEGFEERVRDCLTSNDGVIWHGGVSRSEANDLMSGVKLASGWRNDSFDSTVEISTKVLESAALGIPVLMRPAPVQVAVFGEDLPIWVNSEEEFINAYIALMNDDELYKATAKKMRESVKRYSFSATLQRLISHFD